uniref:Uncharacterized protein n=1 Tax=Rhizophora mucronata TaxID=61149 RepID=A0A2P2N0F6_RHIMU
MMTTCFYCPCDVFLLLS